MKMNDVEICGFTEYLFDHEHMMSHRVFTFSVKT